jgi:hypothetical protein
VINASSAASETSLDGSAMVLFRTGGETFGKVREQPAELRACLEQL